MEATLSKTEQKIIELRLSCKSRKEIASELFRSEGTVRKHFENIARKLHVGDEIEMRISYLKKYKNIILVIVGAVAGLVFKDQLSKVVETLKTMMP